MKESHQSNLTILCRVDQNEAENGEGGLAPSLTRPSAKEERERKKGRKRRKEKISA